jgi:hypothetical protein
MPAKPARVIAPIAFLLLLAGCAQTGPPMPPSLELAKPPTDLRAARKGNRVMLNWSEPALTTDRQSVRYLGPTLVCRSRETDIPSCGIPAAMLPAPAVPARKPESRRARRKANNGPPVPQGYTDILPANMQVPDPAADITYAVEVLNRNARGAGLSNRVHVPAIFTVPAPGDLSAELTGDGVVLTWTSAGELRTIPSNQASKPSATLQLVYRVYRRQEGSSKDAIAGEVPMGEQGPVHFTDSSFEWEKTYNYRVTAVSIVKREDSETQVEGDDTPPVRIVAHDVFPPAVPSGLQAAYSGEGQKPFIDLIWAPVTKADLAGYNVYRSEANGSAVKVNSELVISPSYRDSAVAAGKTYLYSVTAPPY